MSAVSSKAMSDAPHKSDDSKPGLLIAFLFALAPTYVGIVLLVSGAIDGTMLALLPIAAIAYLAMLGYTFARHAPGKGYSVFTFVIYGGLANVAAWFAAVFLLVFVMYMGH
jgi:hypothetical protein